MVSGTILKPLIVIVGQTASGKSDLAMEIARKFKGEIINADSWSVYKGFDIGTAKPSNGDQQQIKHHLINVADPKEGFSAAIFKKQASKAIQDIYKRGKLPIISGGTGLYIDSILFDYSFMPASPAQLREKYNLYSLEELQREVLKYKYDTDGVDLNNKRRLIRLLENKGNKPKSKPIRQNTLIIGLAIEPEKLQKNVDSRINKMIKMGLENEVLSLQKKYGWDIEPMKGIGYREFKKQFEGTQNIEQTKDLIIIHSLQLAKKQLTWFKRNNSIQWVSNRSKTIAIVTTYLNKLSD